MKNEKNQARQPLNDDAVRKALQEQTPITNNPSLLAISEELFEEVFQKKHAQIIAIRDKEYRRNRELDFVYKAVGEHIDRAPHVQGILITGKFGSGKTSLLQAIAETLKFLSNEETKGLSEEFGKTGVVLLDDVGLEQDKAIIPAIITSRYDNQLPTIIASVYDAESLAEIYGCRIGDILSESYVQLGLSINHRIN